jgi:hypothetical protein
MCVIMIASAALREKNADSDADIAYVLRRDGSDRLCEQIERLEAWVQGLREAPAGETVSTAA